MNATIDRSKTQVSTTKGTYQKVANYMFERIPEGEPASVLDYGAGLCHSQKIFEQAKNFVCTAYEPNPKEGIVPDVTRDDEIFGLFSFVVSNCVLNVIEDVQERYHVIRRMMARLKVGGQAIIMVRSHSNVNANKTNKTYNDGFINSKGTFQRGFTRAELEDTIYAAYGDFPFREDFSTENMAFEIEPTKLGDIGIIVERVK